MAGVRERNCPSSSSSRFTAVRSARNVFVAGCSFCLPLAFRPPATTVARCSVSRMGRARTIALAILRESRLLCFLVEKIGQFFLRPLIHNFVRGQRVIGIHAHVERSRPSEKKIRAQGCPARARNSQVGDARHRSGGRLIRSPPLRRCSRILPAPKPPAARAALSRSRAISSACGSRSNP